MSSPETRFMEEVKLSRPADVEHGATPSYPLNEPEVLVVGGPEPRWGWLRRRCGGCSNESTKRSKFFRAIKFVFVGWVLLSLFHFAVAGFRFQKVYKSLKCIDVTPSKHADGLDVTVPLGKSGRIFVHDSLSGGDIHITHDSSIAKDTIRFDVKFSDHKHQHELYDGCVAQFKQGTAVGLIPRKTSGERAKISSFSIRVPPSLTHPSVRVIGKGDKHISDKKLQKVIRWWRKHHEKKDETSIDVVN